MALTFAISGSDEVDFGGDSSIDDWDAFTFWAWLKPGSMAADRFIFSKDTFSVKELKIISAGGAMAATVARDSGSASFETSTGLTGSAWNFVALTYDETDGPRCFIGDLTTTPVEASYGDGPTTGSGSTSVDNAGTFKCPDDVGFGENFDGEIGRMGYINQRLTLGQVQTCWRNPLAFNHGILAIYGIDGVSNVPDFSGNGNAGTAVSAVAADHVPLGPLFGFDDSVPYVVAAAAGFIPYPRYALTGGMQDMAGGV